MDGWPKGRLVELDQDECWQILRAHGVGRVAWYASGRPHLVPVNFVESGGRIWIRTTAYSRLAQEGREGPVAFEVDDVDPFTRSGTSVVVEGDTTPQDAEDLHREAPDLEPWPDGQRALVLAITPRSVTGRRLLPT